MKSKTSLVAVFILIIAFFPGRTTALDLHDLSPEYFGTSLHYATEIGWLFKNSDYVDYDSRQLRLFAGRNISKSWHLEYELVIANIREQRYTFSKDESLYGFKAGLLYDLYNLNRFNLYTGLSGGMGYLRQVYGYAELTDKNPFSLWEYNLGVQYIMDKNYFLRLQFAVFHISSVFGSDQGHNYSDYSLRFGYRFK